MQKLDGSIVARPEYPSGELKTVWFNDGQGGLGGGNGSSLGFTWDSSGVLSALVAKDTLAATIASDQVTRSQSGRVIDQTIDGVDPRPVQPNFTYDAAGRLTAGYVPGRSVTYGYASSGGCGALATAGKNTNRTSMSIAGGPTHTYCYDNADRLTATTDSRYTSVSYDARGNTTRLGPETLTYDGADRHRRTVKGSTTIEYVRDATDRIVERRVNGLTAARYGYAGDGDAPAFTLNAAGLVVEKMISLPGGVLLTKRLPATDVWSYPNIHGDVMATTNALGQKQGGTRNYDPFGEALGGIPDNSEGNFDYGWLGQHQRPTETEAGIATIEMGARAYVPGLGRFLEVDPIEAGSANDYDYVDADPLNDCDLAGEISLLRFRRLRRFLGRLARHVRRGARRGLQGLGGGHAISREDCKRLEREANEILGRGHNPAREKRYDAWRHKNRKKIDLCKKLYRIIMPRKRKRN